MERRALPPLLKRLRVLTKSFIENRLIEEIETRLFKRNLKVEGDNIGEIKIERKWNLLNRRKFMKNKGASCMGEL